MSNSNRLNIMSWNVLSSKAFRHTLNAKRYIGKLDKKKGDINETRKARDSRHYIIIKKIIENDCDLILLQELDGFLSDKIRKKITTHKLITPYPKKYIKSIFGCGILYRIGLFEEYKDYPIIKNNLTKKMPLIIDLKWLNNNSIIPIKVVSLHLDGRTKQTRYHLFNKIMEQCKHSKIKILGGDFNCKEGNNNINGSCFEEAKYNKNIYKTSFPYTTCKFDYWKDHGLKTKKQSIDKIIVSNNIKIINNTIQVKGTNLCKNEGIIEENRENRENSTIRDAEAVYHIGIPYILILLL